MTQSQVVVLDLDGVIIKSNFIKHRAMLSLFESTPEHTEAISAFILANGGVPRKVKISAILENILGVAATPTVIADYLSRYASKLEDFLHSAPLVEGLQRLLRAVITLSMSVHRRRKVKSQASLPAQACSHIFPTCSVVTHLRQLLWLKSSAVTGV